MFGLSKKEKLAKKRAQNDLEIAKHRAEQLRNDAALEKLEAKAKDMESKFCPIMRGNCKKTCIHFRGGSFHTTGDWYHMEYPRCRLWKE